TGISRPQPSAVRLSSACAIQRLGQSRRRRELLVPSVTKEGRPMKSIQVFGIFACVLWLVQAPAKAAESNPIVSISTGQLRGSLTSHGGAVFKNIPFAQPPVGQLR